MSLLNLTFRQWKTVDYLKNNDKHIVVETDKYLGEAALDREAYNTNGVLEHLGNMVGYKCLTKRKPFTETIS